MDDRSIQSLRQLYEYIGKDSCNIILKYCDIETYRQLQSEFPKVILFPWLLYLCPLPTPIKLKTSKKGQNPKHKYEIQTFDIPKYPNGLLNSIIINTGPIKIEKFLYTLHIRSAQISIVFASPNNNFSTLLESIHAIGSTNTLGFVEGNPKFKKFRTTFPRGFYWSSYNDISENIIHIPDYISISSGMILENVSIKCIGFDKNHLFLHLISIRINGKDIVINQSGFRV